MTKVLWSPNHTIGVLCIGIHFYPFVNGGWIGGTTDDFPKLQHRNVSLASSPLFSRFPLGPSLSPTLSPCGSSGAPPPAPEAKHVTQAHPISTSSLSPGLENGF